MRFRKDGVKVFGLFWLKEKRTLVTLTTGQNQAFEDALRRAMLRANINALVPFLNTMSNSNDRLCSGDTAFKIAVEEDFPGCINCVLDHGGINSHQNHGESWSALHRAVGNGNREATNVLLDNGASTESMKADGRTTLFLAVIEEDSEMVDLLLHQRANTEVRDSCGYTPLLHAALRGSPGVIEHLLPKSDFNALDPRRYTPMGILQGLPILLILFLIYNTLLI
jgi:ankyrin repeat protein